MDARLPDFLLPLEQSSGLSKQDKKVIAAHSAAEFEMVFPRVLESVCGGSTLAGALKELPIRVNQGGFMRWLKKHPSYLAMYEEMKEIRTEVWAGRIISHAEGLDEGFENDTARSKLIIDAYKWLMGADNRKKYGDTKQIEINQNISITGALAAAQGRVSQIIDIGADDVEELMPSPYKMIMEIVDVEDDDED